MSHHNIVIRRTGPDKKQLIPDGPIPLPVKQDDTIQWTSEEGPITVEFDGASPFDGEKRSIGPLDTPIAVRKGGKFKYSCILQTAEGPIKWKGGGELEVGVRG